MSENKIAYIDLYGKYKKVLDVYASTSGWVWFITKQPKTTNIWECWVRGLYNEFGTVYKQELLNSSDIYQVPKEHWNDFEEIIFK